jgi:hypothetical protein
MRTINVLFCLVFTSCSGCLFNRISLECKADVTNEYVFFDHCYNGLFIYELDVADSIVGLYPKDFDKLVSYELRQTDSLDWRDTKDLRIYFSKKNSHFKWKVYKYKDWGTGAYEMKDTVQPFKPGKWYLLSFMNPHFQLFAYSDSSLNLKAVKEKLNPNF